MINVIWLFCFFAWNVLLKEEEKTDFLDIWKPLRLSRKTLGEENKHHLYLKLSLTCFCPVYLCKRSKMCTLNNVQLFKTFYHSHVKFFLPTIIHYFFSMLNKDDWAGKGVGSQQKDLWGSTGIQTWKIYCMHSC